ncbi:MAG: MBOAT family protein [Spirochaetales bacterium]|nr:MBOAT family protein [Spirochaetales bacterium]
MLFPTVDFGIFFLIVFFVSWAIRRRKTWHKLFLLAASYFFYCYWDWHLILLLPCLLFGVSAGNYLFAIFIDRAREFHWVKYPEQEGATKPSPRAKALLIIAIVLNLGVLAYFKYYFFLTTNLNSAFLFFGLHVRIPGLPIILPLGISFFTFQAMSYTIDVYRGRYRAARSFPDVLLYTAFFPQLVAGPIVRADVFLPQLKEEKTLADVEFGRAIGLIAFGLFKKVFIANYLGTLLVDPLFENPTAFGGPELLCGVYGYAIQIFCDFSAYSDIAIGLALLLGYHFPANFNNPYRASSIGDFWRRWHISLSTWLRDYLYISLGGNRKGKLATYRNLLITMLLGGLWHGAAWKFLIWGGLHGAGLAVERFVRESLVRPWSSRPLPALLRFPLKAIGVVFTFNFVCLGWIFFRSDNLHIAWQYLTGIFSPATGFVKLTPFLAALIAFGLLIHFLPGSLGERLGRLIDRAPVTVALAGFAGFLVALSAISPSGVPDFIYFQF